MRGEEKVRETPACRDMWFQCRREMLERKWGDEERDEHEAMLMGDVEAPGHQDRIFGRREDLGRREDFRRRSDCRIDPDCHGFRGSNGRVDWERIEKWRR